MCLLVARLRWCQRIRFHRQGRGHKPVFPRRFTNGVHQPFGDAIGLENLKNLSPVDRRVGICVLHCECGKVYISEMGRCMNERIKKHHRDIRLSQTQTSAVFENDNKTGIIRSGTKLRLLTEILAGTLVEFKRPLTWDFTLTTSTGTVQLRFLKPGCLQSDNMTTDLYHSGPLRDQFLLSQYR